MTPAQISKIVFNEEKRRVEAIVPEDQLSIAIGRRGQNVRLASKITNWSIDVMTEEQESKRRTEEFVKTTELFTTGLGVEQVLAQLLSAEGFTTIDQIASSDQVTLESIEGFDMELAQELKKRSIEYIENQNEQIIEDLEQLGVEQDLIDELNLSPEYILKLAEFGIKTIEDLAEVSISEFRNIVPEAAISIKDIEELIYFAQSRNK